MNLIKNRLRKTFASDKNFEIKKKISDYISEHAFEGEVKQSITAPTLDIYLDTFDEDDVKKISRMRKFNPIMIQAIHNLMSFGNNKYLPPLSNFKSFFTSILSSDFTEEEINQYFETEKYLPNFDTTKIDFNEIFKLLKERAKAR